tara:strand:- start:109 stop:387 length:279 start_codon:yes stop_codon:yes gene_type:complete
MTIETYSATLALVDLTMRDDEATFEDVLIDGMMQLADLAYHVQQRVGGNHAFIVNEQHLHKKYDGIILDDAFRELASIYIMMLKLQLSINDN